MNPTRLFTRTIYITHVTPDTATPDEYGNPGETVTTTTALGELQQASRAENTTDGDRQSENDVLLIEPTATLTGSDRINLDTANGDAYEVKGPPWRARNPRTADVSHIEATVRRAT